MVWNLKRRLSTWNAREMRAIESYRMSHERLSHDTTVSGEYLVPKSLKAFRHLVASSLSFKA